MKLGCYFEDHSMKDKAISCFEFCAKHGYPEAYNCLGLIKNDSQYFLKGIKIFEDNIDDKEKLKSIQIYAELCRNVGFLFKKQDYPPSFFNPYFEKASKLFPHNYRVQNQLTQKTGEK